MNSDISGYYVTGGVGSMLTWASKFDILMPAPEMIAHCYFCGDRLKLHTGVDDFVLVTDMIRDGPCTEPKHACCWKCFDESAFMKRSQCQHCGKLASLLYTANNSTTNKWASVGEFLLCDVCIEELGPKRNNGVWQINFGTFEPKFPKKVLLTEEDIAILKKCWKMPDWKERTKMPKILRSIDD